MEKTKLQEYTFRVTQASRSELIVIMYDVILTDTQTAREALEKGDINGTIEMSCAAIGRIKGCDKVIAFELVMLVSSYDKSFRNLDRRNTVICQTGTL